VTYYPDAEFCVQYGSCELAEEECENCVTSTPLCDKNKRPMDVCDEDYECRGETVALHSSVAYRDDCLEVITVNYRNDLIVHSNDSFARETRGATTRRIIPTQMCACSSPLASRTRAATTAARIPGNVKTDKCTRLIEIIKLNKFIAGLISSLHSRK